MMDVREFAVMLRRGLPVLLGAAMLGAAFGVFVFTQTRDAASAETVVSVRFLGLDADAGSGAHQDGYYLIEAQRRFGDMLGTLLRSDRLRRDVEAETGVALGAVTRISPQDFRLALLRGERSADEQTLSASLEAAFGAALEDAVARSGEPIRLSAAVSPPAPRASAWSMPKAVLVGGIFGMLFAVFALLLRHAARPAQVLVEEVLEVDIS